MSDSVSKVEGTWDGKDRRIMNSDQFEFKCKDLFMDINKDIDRLRTEEIIPMREDVTYLKMKVDNGLSTLPKKMNWLIGLLITLVIGSMALVYTGAKNQGKLEAMLISHIETSERLLEYTE